MRRTPALTAVIVALAVPASAQAGTITLDRCYIEQQPAQAVLSGFTPNVPVTIQTDQVFESGTTDATGSATIPFRAPIYATVAPGSKQFTMTATEGEGSSPAPQTATSNFRVANFAFGTSSGTKSPKASRRWRFSGFTPGKAIYAHFRLKGRTRGTYRFGVAKAPCGEFTRRAPGFGIKGRVSPGKWTIQVDQRRSYSRGTRPALVATTTIFTVFRARAAIRGAML